MYKLEDWSVSPIFNDYASPNHSELVLRGEVFDDPELDDGTLIRTAKIVGVEGDTVRTSNGAVFTLGDPAPGYVKWCQKNGVPVRLVDTKKCSNDDLFEAALEVGVHEYAKGHKVMLVVPSQKWTSEGTWQRIRGVWIRASTNGPGVKSLLLDTLILVGQSHHTWSKRGEMLARERLRTSLSPRIITFDHPDWNGASDGYEDS